MNKTTYSKAPLTYKQQLDQLISRGLAIPDEPKTLHLLENISYYRFSGYWYPLLEDKKSHIFKPNASFETAFRLYCFDRKLRQMVLSEIEKIEVAIRAKMAYVMSNNHGAFWFKNPTLFRNPVSHATSLSKIAEEFLRSDEEFILAFRAKYSDPLPPSWIMFEITSFGALSKLYHNLNPTREKRTIAHHFGLSDTVFQTWIHSIVYLRNICAHHTRLWNRTLSISPRIPASPKKDWINTQSIAKNRSYFILSMIRYFLQTINPQNLFKDKLIELFAEYDNAISGQWDSLKTGKLSHYGRIRKYQT